MCLDLTNNIERRVATKDIVCYKRLIHNPDFTPYKEKSFTGIIRGIQCEGKIQIENNCVYFCTNEPALDGTRCDNLLGYKYSWGVSISVQSIIIDGVDIMIPTKDSILMTPYRGAKVKFGETYTSELICECTHRFKPAQVSVGLHSYASYEDAKNNGSGFVVKCIIPKGAGYYEGEFGMSKSYASTQLKYLEIINK